MSKPKRKGIKKGETRGRLAGHADDSNCVGCMYHDPTRWNGSCNYCYITGHMRGSSVEECTKKKIGPPARLSGDIVLDGAPTLGFERRTDRDTAPNKKPARKLKPWEQPTGTRSTFSRAKAWEMYQAKMSDREIADALGVDRRTIANWRSNHDLLLVKSGRKKRERE